MSQVTIYDLELDSLRTREFKTENEARRYATFLKDNFFRAPDVIPKFIIEVDSAIYD